MLEKINKLTLLQVALIISAVGLVVFFTGLNNPFQNDDFLQIVNNAPVHSIKNLPQFFGSSTFYNGEKLTGVYYRPLMTTAFSLIYLFCKADPLAYHLVQLSFYIAGAVLAYLVFKHFFKPILSLVFALIFLIHPINSQIVFSIPTIQDALCFFFGILAIWLLINYKTTRGLLGVAACFLLAMFSKESGILFTVMGFVYLLMFDRSRLKTYLATMILPITFYFALKIYAVGFMGAQHAAPINDLNFIGWLFTLPSVFLFYFVKFIFPWQLSTGYFWVHSTFSIKHVLLPLLADLLIIGLIVYFGIRVRAKLPKKFKTYVFFTLWMFLALSLHMQIIKLDMTACETWFYISMFGLLGMLAVAIQTIKIRWRAEWLFLPVLLVVILFGIRSAARGLDYKSQYKLAVRDVEVSSINHGALNNISQYFINEGKYKEAAAYAQRSINIYPAVSNYTNLGVALQQTGDYPGAVKAYKQALKYGNMNIIYQNLALIYIVGAKPSDTELFFKNAFKEYPHDYKLWLYYAVFECAAGSKDNAKVAISNAAKYGEVPQVLYNNIMNGQSFAIPILGKTLLIK